MSNIISLTIIFFSAFITSKGLHNYLNLSHPSYTPSNKIIYITFCLFIFIFFVFWFFLPYFLLGKNTDKKIVLEIRKKDALSYFILYLMYFYNFSYVVPSLTVFLFLVSKIVIFKNYMGIIIERLEKLWLNVLNIPSIFILYIQNINIKKYKHLNQIIFILKIILILYIALISFSRLYKIYAVPLNQPYFSPGWDEGVSVNSGINILRTKGDAGFYYYGGTSSIPYAISFYLYCKKHNIEPYYKMLGEKFFQPHIPIFRDIYPTKPIYYARIASVILFILGVFLFISLFTWYLLPIPFLLFKIIDYSSLLNSYSFVLMSNTEVAMLTGFTTLFFMITLFSRNETQYFKNLLICFVFASLSISAKLNAAFVILLPLSLLIYMYTIFPKENLFKRKILLKCFFAITIPYIIINPAVLLNTTNYFAKIRYLVISGGEKSVAFSWLPAVDHVFGFIKELYLIVKFPNILLILLVILSSILMIKISPIVFGGYVFFHLYSFFKILNISYLGLFSRLFMPLLLTHIFFILFPFIYIYKHKHFSKYFKLIILLVSLIFTIKFYPLNTIKQGFLNLKNGEFASWQRETRDDFTDYIKKNDLKVYFYDCHHFSLPENIHNNLIFFTDVEKLPSKLEENEVIAYIKYQYNQPIYSHRDTEGIKTRKYWSDIKYLNKKYVVVKFLGEDDIQYGFGTNEPSSNPTIIFLKEKLG